MWHCLHLWGFTYTRIARAAAPGLEIDLVEGSVDATPAVGEVVASLVGGGVDAILITGDLAARILGGEDINRMPIQYSLPMKLVINRRLIPKFKSSWLFPADILDKTTEVGEKQPRIGFQETSLTQLQNS